MNRIAFFAHFDRQDEVKPYVHFYLARLREVCSRVVFVSTSRLSPEDIERLRPHTDEVLLRDNVGWDFGMWKHAFEQVDPTGADELVLTNSSVFGPVYPLAPIFEKMDKSPCDFWAMTDNFEDRWHLQSYFLVFKRNVLRSDALRLFWNSVLPYRNKDAVVSSYELGLTSFLVDSGFRPGALAPTESWTSWLERRRMDLERHWNPTLFYPEILLERGMPFVKVMLLRDNLGDVRLGPVYEMMGRAGYDLGLVKFDCSPRERDRRLRARARRLWSHFLQYSEGSSQLADLELVSEAPPRSMSRLKLARILPGSLGKLG